MNHSFDVDVAVQYGVNAAILFDNIYFWCEHNRANGTNLHDGNYWTYNSRKAFSELFPYMTTKAISTALQKLIDAGLIETGNYNANAYDRTMWYAVTEKGKCIVQKGKMDDSEMSNGDSENVTPIPDINTVVTTDINKDIYDEIITYLNDRAGTSYRASSKKTKDLIKARFNDGFSKDDFFTVIDKKCMDWLKDKEMSKYLRPETLFGTKFESYLNQPMRQATTKDLAANMDLSGFMDF